ncbi:trafficking protein particle complex subunit hypothetical protein [Limosa lapponica baueri]|uniref:TRAPPC10/Trs130 N-terminal domain-containing protein n=1 Tax=Limosa lapponica baueri TaxID=1758121 RepID=A0A2I0T6L7_LIMLA|nr:trafficking protein particle complex subunit hypothetical protein [Limosa lapponica baueri]
MIHHFSSQDTEVYKTTVKDDITKWQNVLKAHNSVDWLIVVVESDAKKKNKTNILPRTSIVDKIRNDFCNKQSDRWCKLADIFLPASEELEWFNSPKTNRHGEERANSKSRSYSTGLA